VQLLMKIVFVAIGSACGGVLRWGIGNWAGQLIDSSLPYATFFINITGSMFLGWFYTRLENWAIPWQWLDPANLRLLVAVGFCGGYTTFSTFEWEGYSLFRDNLTLAGTIYLVASVVLGLIALRVGVALGRF
jgi:CrcB protein